MASDPKSSALRFGLLLLLTIGCGESEEVIQTELRWEPEIRPLITRTCAPCHSRADTLKGPNAHGMNLETYDAVKRHRKKIYTSVVLERAMPESNRVGIALSDEEVRTLGEWIKGGVPR